MFCLILQGGKIRLVVIGQSAHHHIEVVLIHLGNYHKVPCTFPLSKNHFVSVM